ncbi:MAG: CBS domain-containing protein [Paenibacillaceae bacterium ZCTH02-B3]|nr:MAG: CBS domain-containing protein [Paenibacillaceae bacterium ZCTH02-B3]
MKTVADIMTTDCVTVSPGDSIFECAVKMRDNDVGFLPVVDGRRLLGVVTDRDLVVRGYAEKHPGSEEVRNVMTHKAVTIEPSASVEEAARKMAASQIRRLPVVENGELIGVVSLGDLAVRERSGDEAEKALEGISEHEHREPFYAR